MPEPSKKRGNVMSTSKNTEEGLLKGGCAHKVDLEMTIIHSRMKRKESWLFFSKAKNTYFFSLKKKINKTKKEWTKDWGEKNIKTVIYRKW